MDQLKVLETVLVKRADMLADNYAMDDEIKGRIDELHHVLETIEMLRLVNNVSQGKSSPYLVK